MHAESGNQSNANVRMWLFPIAAIVIAGVFALPSFRGSPARRHFAVGKQTLDWRVESLQGTEKVQRTIEDYRGKTVVLHFWGPWCGYCLLELPALAEVEKKFRHGKQTAFLMVSCPRTPEDARRLNDESRQVLEQSKFDFELWTDSEFRTQAEMSRLGVLSGFPTTIAIDPAGRIAAVWNGYHERYPEEIAAFLSIAEKRGVTKPTESP